MGRPSLYYGWYVVAALCVTETVTWGIIYYGYPVFLRPMEADLGASRVAVTAAFSLGLAVSALAAVPVGRWLDRHGPRGLMTLGSCLATLLCFGWARVQSVSALYAVWFGMGFALAATLYEPAFAAVVSWFVTRDRDRALLILTLAAGLASTIFMPIEAWLLVRLGWRTALTLLAVVLGTITIPLHAVVLRRAPAEPATVPGAETRPAQPSLTLGDAARTSIFWVLAAAFVVGNFATVSVTVHLIPYLADHGYAPTVVALMIGWMGAMQLPGRLFFVPVAAWLGPRWVAAGVFAAQGAALVQLPLVSVIPSLVPFVVMFGAANGMSTLARASSIAQIFGPRHYGEISGAVALGANGARAVGPVGASLLVLALGGYERLFWMLAVALAAVSVAVFLTDPDARRNDSRSRAVERVAGVSDRHEARRADRER
ncbi:MAG TPA: MFS transporter [Candidatus Methylomirabilis sp.]|nr:MFS transporter [Candidatus Methylomirabilis sp.]